MTVACGGGSGGSSTPATELLHSDQVNPTSGAWQIKTDPISTQTHVVLGLYPPPGVASGAGITLTLTADSREVAWTFVDSIYVDPVVNVAKVNGSTLGVVVSQAPTATPAVYDVNTPVLRVALDLAQGAVVEKVGFSASGTGHLPAAAGPDTTSTPAPITVELGTLEAQ